MFINLLKLAPGHLQLFKYGKRFSDNHVNQVGSHMEAWIFFIL